MSLLMSTSTSSSISLSDSYLKHETCTIKPEMSTKQIVIPDNEFVGKPFACCRVCKESQYEEHLH